jgi:hypothetical protein
MPLTGSIIVYSDRRKGSQHGRSLDVGDGEKMRDADPLSRGHLIALLLDLYAAHCRLQFRSEVSDAPEKNVMSLTANEVRLQWEAASSLLA